MNRLVSDSQEKMSTALTPLSLIYVIASMHGQLGHGIIDLCLESDPDVALSERLAVLNLNREVINMSTSQNRVVVTNRVYYGFIEGLHRPPL